MPQNDSVENEGWNKRQRISIAIMSMSLLILLQMRSSLRQEHSESSEPLSPTLSTILLIIGLLYLICKCMSSVEVTIDEPSSKGSKTIAALQTQIKQLEETIQRKDREIARLRDATERSTIISREPSNEDNKTIAALKKQIDQLQAELRLKDGQMRDKISSAASRARVRTRSQNPTLTRGTMLGSADTESVENLSRSLRK